MWARGPYRLATRALLAPVLAYFYWRGHREPAYRRHWRERLGRIEGVAPGSIWMHAASVGEVAAVGPLVDALCARYPNRCLLLTTMTPTGRARAKARFGGRVAIRYLPLDTPGATQRFIRAARPRLAVFAETELWPNLVASAARAGVPLIWVSARVSERSAARYGRAPLRRLTADTLDRIDAIGAASARHAERFRGLGARASRVTVTGDLKYDLAAGTTPEPSGRALRASLNAAGRALWVAASTHAGEEALLLAALRTVFKKHPDTLLVLAPRHPRRTPRVARLLAAHGLAFVQRSHGVAATADTAVVLADTLGEVPSLYAAADVVFVGGSLLPGVGGHNVVEAAAAARPVCVGAHVSQWAEIVDALVGCRAAAVCATPQALAEHVIGWLDAPDAARAAGAAGLSCVAARRGALDRSLDLIDGLL